MDDATLGRSIRAVRIKRRMRQADLAEAAGVAQQTISRLEAGRLDHVTLGTVRRVCGVLGIRLTVEARWQGAELDRLLGGRHSAMHEELARLFDALPDWVAAPEVTFAIYGERGRDRHPRLAPADAQPARHRAQDGDRRCPGDRWDARPEAPTRRKGRRGARLGAGDRLVVAAHRRQPDQSTAGSSAPFDAALGVSDRRSRDPWLAPGAPRRGRGHVVLVIYAW